LLDVLSIFTNFAVPLNSKEQENYFVMEFLNKYFVEICLKKFADFRGRARRKEYWMFTLCTVILLVGIDVLGIILSGLSPSLGDIFMVLVGICILIVILPSIAISVRRVHDCGKDWWYILIPIYNLILMFTEGNKGENAYGADPKAGE